MCAPDLQEAFTGPIDIDTFTPTRLGSATSHPPTRYPKPKGSVSGVASVQSASVDIQFAGRRMKHYRQITDIKKLDPSINEREKDCEDHILVPYATFLRSLCSFLFGNFQFSIRNSNGLHTRCGIRTWDHDCLSCSFSSLFCRYVLSAVEAI